MVFHTDKKPLNICGPYIRRARNSLGWSQPKFAEQCQLAGWDVSRDIIARIECQTRCVGDFEVYLLSRVLGVTIQELLPAHVPKKKSNK